jgi:hypothetical protein
MPALQSRAIWRIEFRKTILTALLLPAPPVMP